jgi:16S rRNA (uracil1498-N3)-methyltransferase
MPAERFYLKSPLIPDQTVSLIDEEFHHLSHVMRLKAGEEIQLVNGEGCLAKAKISSLLKKEALISIEHVEHQSPSLHRLVLAQAFPRLPRLEYLLEKSVELGVTDIWLFPGELSEKTELSPSGLKRVHHILISAMKQCGSLFLPSLRILPPLLQWDSKELPSYCFFGDTDPSAPALYEMLENAPKTPSSFLIAIGPEKGFSEKEELFMKNPLSFQGVKLHKHILRTDTAAISSLAIIASMRKEFY